MAGVAVLILLAALVVKGPAVLGRAEKSFGYRLQYWQSSLDMIAAYPWVGCGPGNFQDVYTRYKLPEASEEIADPHNFLMEIWATAGTPAALAFLAVLGCFAVGVRGRGSAIKGQGPGAREGLKTGKWAVNRPPLVPNQQSTIHNQQSLIPNPQSLIPFAMAGCTFLAAAHWGFSCRYRWESSARRRRV